MEDNKLLDKIEKKIIQILKKEGGAAGLAPLKKATDKMDQPKDFDLKKTLKKMDKVEKHKESDYILTPINEKELSKSDEKALKKISKALGGSSKAHKNQADRINKIISIKKRSTSSLHDLKIKHCICIYLLLVLTKRTKIFF